VAEEQHFKRAAARLHMTQSALSRRIQDFESELGAALFERLPGGVRLTGAGQSLRDDAARILAEYERALQRTQRIQRGELGTLRVAISGVAIRHPRVLRQLNAFRAARPGVELTLAPMVSSEQVDALQAGEIDAGFVYGPLVGVQGIAARPVFSHDFLLAMPADHALARRRRLRLRDLSEENFIWSARRTRRGAGTILAASAPYDRTRATIYDRMIAACRRGGLTPHIVAEQNTAEARLNLVAAGMGLCFVDDLQRGETPGVVLRRIAEFSVPIAMHLAWRRGDASPVLASFIEAVAK
jgi:DNA-binding transcriptional LysR family regulator